MQIAGSYRRMSFLKKLTLPSCSPVSITYWGRSSCSNSDWLSCSDTFKIDNTTFCIFLDNHQQSLDMTHVKSNPSWLWTLDTLLVACGGKGLPCDEFGRVFASLWLQQQDKEGSRYHDPCGGYQEFDNKQDDDLCDSSI